MEEWQLFIAKVNKLWDPYLTHYFFLNNLTEWLYIFNDWKNKKNKNILWLITILQNSNFSVHTFKFSWNMSICLHTVYSCFCMVTTELSSCDNYHMSCKSLKYLLSSLFQEGKKKKTCWPLIYSTISKKREGEDGIKGTCRGIGLEQEKGYFILWNGKRVMEWCKYK